MEYYPFNKKVFDSWIRDNAARKYRTNYPNLDRESIVVDCGGFHGDWAESINSLYGCRILIFEPLEKS